MKNLKLKIQGFLLLLAVAAFAFLPEQVGAQDTPGFISVTVKSGRDTLPVYVSVGDFRWAVADGTGSLIMYGNKIKTLKVLENIEDLNDVAALYCGRITAVILTNGNGILLGNKFVSDVRTSGSGSVITMSGVQETFKSSQSMSTVLSNIECTTNVSSASNGITYTDGTVKLGGQLTAATTIDLANRTLTLAKTGTASVALFAYDTQAKITLNLPTYANNAAALAGGLTAGMLYKTSAGVVNIVV
jgi:hypothetical protein